MVPYIYDQKNVLFWILNFKSIYRCRWTATPRWPQSGSRWAQELSKSLPSLSLRFLMVRVPPTDYVWFLCNISDIYFYSYLQGTQRSTSLAPNLRAGSRSNWPSSTATMGRASLASLSTSGFKAAIFDTCFPPCFIALKEMDFSTTEKN